MMIALTTPTGHVGRHVLRQLVQAGIRPRTLMRDPGALSPDLRRRVDALAADQLDADSVVAATTGVDTIHWVSPPTELDDPLEGYRRATASLIEAVRANRIRRVVLQSSVGAEVRHGMGDIDGLASAEVALDAEDVSVTHLRCGYFFSNLAMDPESLRSGTMRTAMDPDRAFPWVAPEDIAGVTVARLLNADWSGRHVQAVHGPVDLSFREVAQILAEVLGHPMSVVQISDDDVRTELRTLGMTETQVEAIVAMTAGQRHGFAVENPRDFSSTTPTTLGAWAWAHLRPTAQAMASRAAARKVEA